MVYSNKISTIIITASLLVLSSCGGGSGAGMPPSNNVNPDVQEPVDTPAKGLVALSRAASASECPTTAGTALDVFLDMDNSGTYTTDDTFQSSISVCNAQAVAGTNGTNGTNGINGTNGVDGTNGTNGTVGATGPQGPAGPQGTPGLGMNIMVVFSFNNISNCQTIIPGLIFANKSSTSSSNIRLYTDSAVCAARAGSNSNTGVAETLSYSSNEVFAYGSNAIIFVEGTNGSVTLPLALKKLVLN